MPAVMSKLSADSERIIVANARLAKADRAMGMPATEAEVYNIEVLVDDVILLETAYKPRFPDTPWTIIQRLVRSSRAFGPIAAEHGTKKIMWLQKPLDASNGGHDTKQHEILSRFARFHELHFHSDGFVSDYIVELESLRNLSRPPTATSVGTRIVSLDMRLSDDALAKTARRMNRLPHQECSHCGGLEPNKLCACGKARYCTVRCQRGHWGEHKRDCTAASGPAAADARPAISFDDNIPANVQAELDAIMESDAIKLLRRTDEEDTLICIRSAPDYGPLLIPRVE